MYIPSLCPQISTFLIKSFSKSLQHQKYSLPLQNVRGMRARLQGKPVRPHHLHLRHQATVTQGAILSVYFSLWCREEGKPPNPIGIWKIQLSERTNEHSRFCGYSLPAGKIRKGACRQTTQYSGVTKRMLLFDGHSRALAPAA